MPVSSNLKFRLEDIPGEGWEGESDQDPGWLDDRFSGEEKKLFRFLSPIRVHLTLSRSGRVVLVKSQARAEMEFTCDRCLEPFPLVLSSEYKASLKPKPAIPADEESDPDGKNLDTEFYEGEEIDLTPLVQDQVLLAIPSKAVCRKDCQGLCQHCGQNKNRGTCHCAAPDFDPRLEPLKKFRV
jgi:uncharacterized protein